MIHVHIVKKVKVVFKEEAKIGIVIPAWICKVPVAVF